MNKTVTSRTIILIIVQLSRLMYSLLLSLGPFRKAGSPLKEKKNSACALVFIAQQLSNNVAAENVESPKVEVVSTFCLIA